MVLTPKSNTDDRFGTQDTVVLIHDKGGSFKFKFQIKNNSGSKPGNQKVEGTIPSAAAARAGKAPQEFIRPLFKEYGMTFQNEWKEYPQSPVEFMKEFDKHYKRFESIHSKVECGIPKTKKAFKAAFLNSWADKSDSVKGIPQDKLMQIHFISDLYKMNKEKMEDCITDLVFLSMKQGPRFGPFGKLY